MEYSPLWVARHHMPDDRLMHAKIDVEREGGVITLSARYGHIHPVLFRAMATFSKAFAEARLFELEPEQQAEQPELQVWFERVPDRLMGGLPMRTHYGGLGPKFFEILVDEDLVEPELIK